jgi:hypothetical protein
MTGGNGANFNMGKINEAVDAYLKLIDLGFSPFCPQLSVFCELLQPGRISYEKWLEYDFDIIKSSDAVLRIPGVSPGADRECEYARSIGVPVYFMYDLLLKFKSATTCKTT